MVCQHIVTAHWIKIGFWPFFKDTSNVAKQQGKKEANLEMD